IFILFIMISNSFAAPKADIDLTKLNSMMTYSTLFNILTNPDSYLGKTIKIKGIFDSAKDPDTGIDYFAVVIMDASACCSSGLDFSLKKKYKYEYPKDFPELGEDITVIGKFERYSEGENIYYHLAEADMIK
ncbi:MAG: hypothetical protein IKN30_01260, partial [Synergistaceae bacterium]|nr:hypothetical protein [Synergistaceae bacterium]